MKLLSLIIASAVLYGQAQTEIKIIPKQDDSATGIVKFQEKYANGSNYVGLRAPNSISSNVLWTLPSSDGTSGQCLQTDGSGTMSWEPCGSERLVSDYDWSQTLGALSAPGTVTVTFTSCPAAATDTQYVARIYESSTPTTYSLHTQNGAGTCTRGGAGTLIFTSVSGTYTNAIITSASAGFQEAIFSVADGLHVRARAAIGSYSIYSPILTEDRAVLIECESLGAGLIPRVDNLKVIHTAAPTGIRVKNCLFTNAYAVANATAIYADNPDGANYGGLIEGNWFSSFDKSIHAVTISGWVISKNHFLNSTNATAAIHVENVTNGDQGVGLIHGNILTCGATCTYGLLWNGPGALQLKHNNFNGYTTQVHLQPKFGSASSSGSTVTWQSGNKFRSILAGRTIYLGSLSAVIASVNSATQITTATPLGTVSTTDYYVNATSQLQISSNNFDSGANTTKGIRWEGPVTFQNGQIENNFFSNWSGVTNFEAISIASAGANFLSIRGNNIQSPQATTGTYGIRLTGGSTVSVTDNQIVGSKTAISVESGASAVTLSGNSCRFNDTACVTSAVSDTVLHDQITVTFAQLSGLSVANSSRVYCSDCKQSTTACASSGSGAVATRINSTWQCQDQISGYQPWLVSGSDVYRSSGNVAIGSTPTTSTLLVKGASGAPGLLEMKHGTATSSLQLYAESSYSVLGTYTATPLIFATDSAGRWRFTSAGILQPESTDTYDIGVLSGARVRGVYTKILDTALSGGTGDYMQTRKLQLFDNTGSSTGASFWDVNVVMSGVGAGQNSYFYIRDNAGSNVVKMERIASGSAVSRTTWYTDLLPDTTAGRNLGSAALHWGKMWVDTLASDLFPDTTDTYVLGNGTKRWSSVRTLDFRADGAITFSSGAANGYVWTSDASGVGSWQASASGAWTVSGSDAYRATGSVWVGKSTNNIGAKLEVENSASVNLLQLKYTGTVSSISGGGISAHQGSLPTAADQRLGFLVFGVESGGTQYNRAAIMAFSSQTWSAGSAEGEYLQFLTTASGSTTRTARWRVADSGDWLPEAATTYSVGSSGARTLKLWTSALDASGAVTFSGSTITASSTFSSDLIPTSASTYALGSSSFRWLGYLSTLNVSSTFTLNGSITGDLTFTAANTYVLGDSTNYLNAAHVNTYQVYGQVKPGSGVTTADLGGATTRFRKLWTGDINANGTITAPDGNTGVSATKTVRDSTGTGTCTLIFSGGILTGGTC